MRPALSRRQLLIAATLAAPMPMTRAWAQATYPLTITDDRGAVVEIPARPRRVAAISNFAADFMLSVGERPVAITSYGERLLPEFLGPSVAGIPDLGLRTAPNLERLAALQPDLIFAIRRYTEPNARRLAAIAPYLAYDTITAEDSDRAILALARALGMSERGAAINAAYQAIARDFSARAPGGVSAALLWGAGDAPLAYHDHYMSAGMIGLLKGTNIAGPSRNPRNTVEFGSRINFEDLLQRDPDVLFVMMPNDANINRHPLWARLKAVRGGRAHAVGFHWMEVHGPLAREQVLREMAHLLYPAVFSVPPLPERARAATIPGV